MPDNWRSSWSGDKGEFMSYTRFGLYYLPQDRSLANFGASWLGWDVEQGAQCTRPNVPGLAAVTATPRSYGFHGTLKPPFRLASGTDLDGLKTTVAALAARTAPAQTQGLKLNALGRFLALTPIGDLSGLARIANSCVREVDTFRAPASDEELARRRAAGLTPEQDSLLMEWGYPYVMDEFRFHLTLTGRVAEDQLDHWRAVLEDRLPALPTPFWIDQIALVGEREDGFFELIHRYALTG